MGIIRKQSIQGSIFTYIGVIIGFVSSGLLMPNILPKAGVGLIHLIIPFTETLSLIATVGFASIIVRMFPYFRNKNNRNNGFGFLTIVVTFSGIILVSIFLLLFKEPIISLYLENSELFTEYFHFLFPLIIFTTLFMQFDSYNSAVFSSVRGTIYKEFINRIMVLLLLALYYFKIIEFKEYMIWFSVAYCLPGIALIIHLFIDKEIGLRPNFKLITPKLRKEMLHVAGAGLLAGGINILGRHIDKMVIGSYLGIDDVAVYSIAFVFTTVILVPSRAIVKISGPVIAESWKRNDLKNVFSIYKQSVVNQYLLSAFLLMGIIINIDNIYCLLPTEYKGGELALILLSISALVEMLSGMSGIILHTSKHYKLYTVLSFIYSIILPVLLFLFIKEWNIAGAALAVLVTKILLVAIRYVIVLKKFKMQPYDKRTLLITIILIGTLLINMLIPKIELFYLDILIRSSILSILFIVAAYYLKIVPEMFDFILNTVKSKLKISEEK